MERVFRTHSFLPVVVTPASRPAMSECSQDPKKWGGRSWCARIQPIHRKSAERWRTVSRKGTKKTEIAADELPNLGSCWWSNSNLEGPVTTERDGHV